MPTITERPATPAVINDSLPVPTTFPEIPKDVTKRFPSMSDYKDQVDTWWKKTKAALTDMNEDASTTIQQIKGVQENQKAASGGFTAAINVERIARITADGALASLITTVTADYHAADVILSASITTETTARVTADSALATSITTIDAAYQAADTTLQAHITTEATTRATADTALSTLITTLTSTVTTNNTTLTASISSEATTRASADSALSSRIDALVATAGSHVFVQTSAPTALGIDDLWWDSDDGFRRYYWNGSAWVDATDAQITTTAAAVTTEQTARISGDTVLASTITTQIAIVNGNIASAVSTEASARATSDGFLEGKYTLTVVAGNVVTGMNITSSTGTGTTISSVIFQASEFKIYNGTSGVAPFQVVGGQVKVTGSLVITNSDVSGLGTLATLGSVDLATGQVTNKSLANLDSTANTKLSGIAAGATVGADWSSNLTGRPLSLTDGRVAIALNSAGTVVTNVVPASVAGPTSAGLYLGSDLLGYYNGSAWKSYMDNSGHFFLAGGSGNALAWDGTTLTIVGNITVTGGNAATTSALSSGLSGKIDTAGAAADVNANSTTISGSKIRAGTIESNNWGSSAGSQFDLTNGTFALGGSSSPALQWDGSALTVHGILDVGSGASRTYIDTSKFTFGYGASTRTEIYYDSTAARLDMYDAAGNLAIKCYAGTGTGSVIQLFDTANSTSIEIGGFGFVFATSLSSFPSFQSQVAGDSDFRWKVRGVGEMVWGDGSGATWATITPSSGQLDLNASLSLSGNLKKSSPDGWTPVLGGDGATHAIDFSWNGSNFLIRVDGSVVATL